MDKGTCPDPQTSLVEPQISLEKVELKIPKDQTDTDILQPQDPKIEGIAKLSQQSR